MNVPFFSRGAGTTIQSTDWSSFFILPLYNLLIGLNLLSYFREYIRVFDISSLENLQYWIIDEKVRDQFAIRD